MRFSFGDLGESLPGGGRRRRPRRGDAAGEAAGGTIVAGDATSTATRPAAMGDALAFRVCPPVMTGAHASHRLCRPRRTLRPRGVPGRGLRLPAPALRLIERRGVSLEEARPCVFGPPRTPAFGLKGGVGKTTLPTLRPFPPRIPMSWPCAGTSDARKNASNRTPARAALTVCVFTAGLSFSRSLAGRVCNVCGGAGELPASYGKPSNHLTLASWLILARTDCESSRTSSGP